RRELLRSIDPYRGMTTATSSPQERSARGSEPTTSASPPVLASGAASEETIRTRDTKKLYQHPRKSRPSAGPAVNLRRGTVHRLLERMPGPAAPAARCP